MEPATWASLLGRSGEAERFLGGKWRAP